MKTPEQIADELAEENQDHQRPVAAALYVAKKIAQYGPTYPVFRVKRSINVEMKPWYDIAGSYIYNNPKLFWKEVIRILDDRA